MVKPARQLMSCQKLRAARSIPPRSLPGTTRRDNHELRPAIGKARDAQAEPSAPRADAIDAAICIAAGIVADRSTRDGPGPQHDAGPRNATNGIVDVLAIRRGRRCGIDGDACDSQEGARSNSRNCQGLDRKKHSRIHDDPPSSFAHEGGESRLIHADHNPFLRGINHVDVDQACPGASAGPARSCLRDRGQCPSG